MLRFERSEEAASKQVEGEEEGSIVALCGWRRFACRSGGRWRRLASKARCVCSVEVAVSSRAARGKRLAAAAEAIAKAVEEAGV